MKLLVISSSILLLAQLAIAEEVPKALEPSRWNSRSLNEPSVALTSTYDVLFVLAQAVGELKKSYSIEFANGKVSILLGDLEALTQSLLKATIRHQLPLSEVVRQISSEIYKEVDVDRVIAGYYVMGLWLMICKVGSLQKAIIDAQGATNLKFIGFHNDVVLQILASFASVRNQHEKVLDQITARFRQLVENYSEEFKSLEDLIKQDVRESGERFLARVKVEIKSFLLNRTEGNY